MQDSFIERAGDWAEVPRRIRAGLRLPEPWESRFGALSRTSTARCLAVGQLGQSLDGRIATPSGHSQYINGSEGLAHLHRLRAVVDAVVVGAGTVRTDDPQLTVRHVEGPSPARVVIDPSGSLPATARAFADDGIRRLVIMRKDAPSPADSVEAVRLPQVDGVFAPSTILDALAARGLRRVLIEGGAKTLSYFLSTGCLDRLHVVVAPVILGSGIAGLALPPIDRMSEALRVPMRAHSLGDEVLFDCDLSGQVAEQVGKPGA
jgi:diaminohydroxyphosphoribosylaminopyrimidine deaminase / 5-amino-6-(5-phosphoribosylamino)uracil reductase